MNYMYNRVACRHLKPTYKNYLIMIGVIRLNLQLACFNKIFILYNDIYSISKFRLYSPTLNNNNKLGSLKLIVEQRPWTYVLI